MVGIFLTIPGVPVPKGRPRFGRGRTYTPRKTLDYENLVKFVAIDSRNRHGWKRLSGPVKCTLRFYGASPKADLDNLVKCILDGLNGLAFDDDRQVAELVASRIGSGKPETLVEIQALYPERPPSAAIVRGEGSK